MLLFLFYVSYLSILSLNLFGESLFCDIVLHDQHLPIIFTVCVCVAFCRFLTQTFITPPLFFIVVFFFSPRHLFALQNPTDFLQLQFICCFIINVSFSLSFLLINFYVFFYHYRCFFFSLSSHMTLDLHMNRVPENLFSCYCCLKLE